MDIINERAFNIVSKHFGLENESLQVLKDLIEKDDNIAPEYKPFLNEDRRFYIELGLGQLEKIDAAWDYFNTVVPKYIETFKVSYKNFCENKLSLRGSPKLFKHFKKNYVESPLDKQKIEMFIYGMKNKSLEDQAEEVIRKINVRRNVGSSPIKLVFSLNFADWLLCSTAESWSSCYDLESNYDMCYWSGIPGLFGDKSRILAYITDGTKKEYQGITVDRILSRTFVSILENNEMYINRCYPNTLVQDVLSNIQLPNLDFKSSSSGSVSKYPLKKIYYENSFLCVPYTDNGTFIKNKEDLFFEVDSSDFVSYDKQGNTVEEVFINYDDGLSALISADTSLARYFGECGTCNWCCGAFNFDDLITSPFDNEQYCSDCFTMMVGECQECYSPIDLKEEKYETVDDETICPMCLKTKYFFCNACNEYFKISSNEMFKIGGKIYCEECFEEREEKRA